MLEIVRGTGRWTSQFTRSSRLSSSDTSEDSRGGSDIVFLFAGYNDSSISLIGTRSIISNHQLYCRIRMMFSTESSGLRNVFYIGIQYHCY